MIKFAGIVAIAATVGLAGASFAQETTPTAEQPAMEAPATETTAAPAATRKGPLGADANNDGMVTKAEWDAAKRPAKRFDMMDTDHDGTITKAEMKTARAMMKKKASGASEE